MAEGEVEKEETRKVAHPLAMRRRKSVSVTQVFCAQVQHEDVRRGGGRDEPEDETHRLGDPRG